MKRREFLSSLVASSVILPLSLEAKEDDDYKVQGNSLKPEYSIQNGKVVLNEGHFMAMSMCHGCTTKCGLRVHFNDDEVLRCIGNPYHPSANFRQLDYETPLNDAFVTLATSDEQRSTVCSRGASLPDMLKSELRITKPLKRVGKRGEGKWKSISIEQLVEEIVEGGNLFGEGQVDGLRAIYNDELIDKQNPEYGTKRNQLLSFYLYDGRSDIVDRFIKYSFGTINHYSHGAICGGGFRAGGKIVFDSKGFMHTKPDFENQKFSIYWGTAPANGSNPFQRQAKQVAYNRSKRDDFSYAVVDPTLSDAVKYAVLNKGKWIPIKTGTDSALAMAMIRWIIENKKYNASFLSSPNLKFALKNGHRHYSNASFLIITEEGHKDYGKFVKFDNKWQVFIKNEGLKSYETNKNAEIFYDGFIEIDGIKTKVASSMELLRKSALSNSIDEYLEICGVKKEDFLWLCDNFTKNAPKVCVDVHGGMMHTQAAMSTFAILSLNTLVGNYGHKGGAIPAEPGIYNYKTGRYDLVNFKGKFKPNGVNLSRSGKYYESSSEYKRKIENNQNPYPATQPWYPISMPLINETLTSHMSGYPYKAKIFINYMTNVMYNQAGLKTAALNLLKDSRDLPLFIAIDTFMNETNAYADYIVPDGLNLENYALPNSYWGTLTKASVVRYPLVKGRQDSDKNGEQISVESFFIAVAKKLKMPGFGKNAFKDKDGKEYDFDKKEQFYAAAFANLAYDKEPLADISKEDKKLAPLHKIMPKIQKYLKDDEIKKVEFLLSRGGRFENLDKAYIDDKFTKFPTPTPASIYYEKLGAHKHSITGKYMPGTPYLALASFYDGTPLSEIYNKKEWKYSLSSRKSNIQHYYTIASKKLHSIHKSNVIRIAENIAQEQDIKSGDNIKIITPFSEVSGECLVTRGVAKDCISIEHGFGHDEFGARAHNIDGADMLYVEGNGSGINYNKLGMLDIKRGAFSLNDWLVGTCARQAIPAKIVKA